MKPLLSNRGDTLYSMKFLFNNSSHDKIKYHSFFLHLMPAKIPTTSKSPCEEHFSLITYVTTHSFNTFPSGQHNSRLKDVTVEIIMLNIHYRQPKFTISTYITDSTSLLMYILRVAKHQYLKKNCGQHSTTSSTQNVDHIISSYQHMLWTAQCHYFNITTGVPTLDR